MEIKTDFPGSNIVVEGIEEADVYLYPDLRGSSQNWFYWAFDISVDSPGTITFHFTPESPPNTTSNGAAVSLDEGLTWDWLGPPEDPNIFSYDFKEANQSIRLALAPMYTQVEWQRFLADLPEWPGIRLDTLTKSREGRDVDCCYLCGEPDETPYRILLTARNHCCEMIADYVIEGILSQMLAEDNIGEWFQTNTAVMVVPFVDKDGVENGDQGKNRAPHDHNRDYDGDSIYPEVRALREKVPIWTEGKLDVGMDIHCPWVRNELSECIYLVGSPHPEIWEEQQDFGKILEQVSTGMLPYLASDNLAFGEDWNTAENYSQGRSCCRWMAELPGTRFASSMEVPYALVKGTQVTPDAARSFGRDLAEAVKEYLMGKE